MHIPWKKIGTGALKLVEFAGSIGDPHAIAIVSLIHAVEDALPQAPGTDKQQAVINASDALLELSTLTDTQKQAIRDARAAFIDAYVAAKNAEATAEDAYEKVRAAIAAVKSQAA